jgi:eukaryotic-like serine/threonine-protein kinase
MFVGRVRELAHLRSALNDCLGGRGKMFVATGEAGIGKTSLARKVADMAAQQGFEVVWGRCWEGAEAPAFWPWIQIFRSLCAQGPSSAAATEIAGLVPVLQDPGEPDRPEHALFRLFDGAASHLQNRSAERPLVLILEDLHEADRTSLKLLNFLARQIDASRLLVFGTCRKPEMDLSPLGEDLATLMRLGQRIPLSGLRESEVAELLAHGFGMVLSAEELSSLRHRTEGNPFFVDEIARDLVSQEQPAQFTTATIQVPEGLKAPIRRRLAALRDEDRSLLALAAVIGREFEFEVVTTAGELARESALQRLSALATRRLVAPAGFGIGPYRFSHALVRETVYEDLEDLERRELHARVGRAIEHLHGSELDRYVDQLAHHFLQAAVLGETQRAMNYSRRAGLLASRRLGYDEAIEHYRRALALAGTAQPSMSIDLLLSLGDAQWWAGRPAARRMSTGWPRLR